MATNNDVDLDINPAEIFSISDAKAKIKQLDESRKELSEKLADKMKINDMIIADQNKLNETVADEIKCLNDMTAYLEAQLKDCKAQIAVKNRKIIQIRSNKHKCATTNCLVKTMFCWNCILEK